MSAVHDLLSLQHNTFGANQSAIDFLSLLSALLCIVSEVRLNVLHEVEPMQSAMVETCAILLVDEVFVGSLLGEELAETTSVRLIIVIDAHPLRLLRLEMRQFLTRKDADGIDVLKLFAQMRLIVIGCALHGK